MSDDMISPFLDVLTVCMSLCRSEHLFDIRHHMFEQAALFCTTHENQKGNECSEDSSAVK